MKKEFDRDQRHFVDWRAEAARFEAGRAELDAEISRLRAALRWVHDNVSPENVAAIRRLTSDVLALVCAVCVIWIVGR